MFFCNQKNQKFRGFDSPNPAVQRQKIYKNKTHFVVKIGAFIF